jgi:hypothetical protein
MSDIVFELESGKRATFETAGKRLDDNIVVTATGGSDLQFSDFSYFCYYGARYNAFLRMDKSKARKFGYLFGYFNTLKAAPELDWTNITNAEGAFYQCNVLDGEIELSLPSAVAVVNLFSHCYKIKKIILRKTKNGLNFPGVAYRCWELDSLIIENAKGGGFKNVITECYKLTNLYIGNITENLQVASGTSWGHLLTVESLVGLIQELIPSTTLKTLTMGSVNLEKIANLYCRITDDTSEKLTMELCESTDEGAMTLEQYALLKNWQFR